MRGSKGLRNVKFSVKGASETRNFGPKGGKVRSNACVVIEAIPGIFFRWDAGALVAEVRRSHIIEPELNSGSESSQNSGSRTKSESIGLRTKFEVRTKFEEIAERDR
jgi:hypothetical protein